MLIDDIKRVLGSMASDTVKVKEIQRLVEKQTETADYPFFDLIITDDRIKKFKHLIPENKVLTKVDLLSVKRLVDSSDQKEPVEREFEILVNDTIYPDNSNTVLKTDFTATFINALVDFKVLIGFNLKAVRIEIIDSLPLIHSDEPAPFPTFKLRFHLEDKPCNSSNVS